VSHNGNSLNANINGKTAETRKAGTSTEENQALHGDWLVVSRKNKAHNQFSLNSSKTVTLKTNRFNILNSLTQQVKHASSNKKLLTWKKP